MNFLDFVQYPSTKVKTACGYDVNITEIVKEDKYPIKGTYYSAGLHNVCEWDINGYPYRLPSTHGLHLLPFLPTREWYRVDENLFKSATNYSDLVKSS